MWQLTAWILIQTALLITCQENTEPREVRIVIAKRWDDGNILLRLSPDFVIHNLRWQQIHAGNSRDGDMSYFTVYDRSEGVSRILDHETTNYGYDDNIAKQINVCSQDNNSSLITIRDCSTIGQDVTKKFSFFPANSQKQGTRKIYATICRNKRTQAAYSTLSTKNNFCWTGSRVVGGHNFYAYIGNLFCAPLGRTLGSSWIVNRTYEDGIRVASVTYQCPSGYKLNGHETLTCGSDGSWNENMPTCKVTSCGVPPPIEHGHVSSLSTSYVYSMTAIYTCDEGYIPHPAVAVIECLESGMWSNVTIDCRHVDCGKPDRLRFGYINGLNFTYGASVEFKCHPGFSLLGSTNATCQKDGTWTKYLTICQKIYCPIISIAHGSLGDYQLAVDNEVAVKCNLGYKLQGANTLKCLMKNGSTTEAVWSHPLPYCSVVSCAALSPIHNGLIDGLNLVYGSELNYACNPGYSLLGNETLSCTLNGWSSEPPICQECPVGYYKEGTNTAQCTPCPPNYNTTCQGSFNLLQCVCGSSSHGHNSGLWAGSQSGAHHVCSITCGKGTSCSATGLHHVTCKCSPLPDVGHSEAVCEADANTPGLNNDINL